MKIFLEPTGIFSRAMVRIAVNLGRYLPAGYTLTNRRELADLIVLYVIGPDAIDAGIQLQAKGQSYATVMCCLHTTGLPATTWGSHWRNAQLVWSYFDLTSVMAQCGGRFYHAPLGLDQAFVTPLAVPPPRTPLIITTGYVSGPGAEAIEEVWTAANQLNIRAMHLGPAEIEGMKNMPVGWQNVDGISDANLAFLYHRATWVSALRHIEGFELPGIEGLACGARPIIFNQPTMREWYGDSGIVIDECSGLALVEQLTELLAFEFPVTEAERDNAKSRFNWETICRGFWDRVVDSYNVQGGV